MSSVFGVLLGVGARLADVGHWEHEVQWYYLSPQLLHLLSLLPGIYEMSDFFPLGLFTMSFLSWSELTGTVSVSQNKHPLFRFWCVGAMFQ